LFIDVHAELTLMGGDGTAGKKSPIDLTGLPESVTLLCDTMIRIDPNWSLEEWLDRCAKEELELAASHLGREKLRLEQRLSRVKDIARDMGRDNEMNALVRNDPFQRNLFDVYDGIETTTKTDVAKILESAANEHPPITDDDPMLAMISARILDMAEQASANGSDSITWEEVISELIPSGLLEEEVDEAIAHLVQNGQLIEFRFGNFSINDI